MVLKFEELTDEIGQELVQLSRKTLEAILTNKPLPEIPSKPIYQKKSGVFCTLNKHGELRGCIGYPTPEFPLGIAIINSTKFAALEDPRFPPVTARELSDIEIELTILTPPEKLQVKDYNEYFSLIKIGRDGLIASRGYQRGLLLPQVAVEYNWNVEEFLNHTCMKAGIYPPDSWKNINEVTIERFQGKIFHEKKR